MPSFTFNDSDNLTRLVDPGEYMAEIIGFEFGYSRSGNETLTLVLRQEPDGVIVFDTLTFTEKAFWRIDTMLKCFLPSKGIGKLDKGKTFDINEKFCERFLLNARGPVKLIKEEYPVGTDKWKNRVDAFNVPDVVPMLGKTPRWEKVEKAAPMPEAGSYSNQGGELVPEEEEDIPF